jgi:hypothetical protein
MSPNKTRSDNLNAMLASGETDTPVVQHRVCERGVLLLAAEAETAAENSTHRPVDSRGPLPSQRHVMIDDAHNAGGQPDCVEA